MVWSWKKAAGVLAVSSLVLLGACSSEGQTTSSEQNATEANKAQEEKQKADVKITQETYTAWKDSIGTVWVNYSAEVTNNGAAPAQIGSIQINYEDAEENVLGTESMVSSVPDVLNPGETAYFTETTMLDTVKDPSVLTKAYANLDFDTTEDKPYYLTTTNVKLTENTNEWDDGSPYIVTGSIVNEGDQSADDIRVAAGLYDENDKLVGVLSGTVDVTLAPDGKAAFELNYPEIGPSVKGKAKTVKVSAFNWTW
jgi:hypothetical protein